MSEACRLVARTGPTLPDARGPLSAFLIATLRRPVHRLVALPDVAVHDAVGDDDLQLALYLCYELHYRSFDDVDDGWEWEPSLLRFRRHLEDRFEMALRRSAVGIGAGDPESVVAEVQALIASGNGPSLSARMLEGGTVDQFREFAIHRSAYQLKEADPHTWVIPRLTGRAKAACVEIQSDEYGGGHETQMHSHLFAAVLEALGLDSTYGAYLGVLPGITLATVNLISLFGLHRRWRGALVGHLAVFEMTSVVPMGRYADTVDRLGLPPAARAFYDVHVAADTHHAAVAADGMIGGLARSEPHLVNDIVFGARALMAVEGRFAAHLLESWAAGRTSLRLPT